MNTVRTLLSRFAHYYPMTPWHTKVPCFSAPAWVFATYMWSDHPEGLRLEGGDGLVPLHTEVQRGCLHRHTLYV